MMRKLLLLLSVAAIAAVGYCMTTHSDGANIQPTDQNTQVVSDSNQAAQSIENRLWSPLEDGAWYLNATYPVATHLIIDYSGYPIPGTQVDFPYGYSRIPMNLSSAITDLQIELIEPRSDGVYNYTF